MANCYSENMEAGWVGSGSFLKNQRKSHLYGIWLGGSGVSPIFSGSFLKQKQRKEQLYGTGGGEGGGGGGEGEENELKL